MLILIERLVVIPVRIRILLRCARCTFGCPDCLLTEVSKIAILQVDQTFFDVVALQLWFRLTGEKTAAWSLVVAPLDDMDRSIRVTQGIWLRRDIPGLGRRYLDRRERIRGVFLIVRDQLHDREDSHDQENGADYAATDHVAFTLLCLLCFSLLPTS
jgi:hypothetical protein